MPSSRSTCRPKSTAASATWGLAGTISTSRSWRSIAATATPIASWPAMRPSSSPWLFDGKGDVECEPTGPNEAILFRSIELPAGGQRDGRHAGQRRIHRVERRSRDVRALAPARPQLVSVEPISTRSSTPPPRSGTISSSRFPDLYFPKPTYAVILRRSALAAALHADAEWGAIASGFDRGLSAYCWPRDAIWVSGAMERLGHPSIGRGVYQWLNKVRHRHRPFLYWFQKYSLDGVPEWETPAVDQTALIPWGLERHYRRTGDLDLVAAVWPMIEQAAAGLRGRIGRPSRPDDARRPEPDQLGRQRRSSSSGRFSTPTPASWPACGPPRGSPARLGINGSAERWNRLRGSDLERRHPARSIATSRPGSPGMIDPDSGRFLQARRLSKLRGLWTNEPESLDRPVDHARHQHAGLCPSRSACCPPADPRLIRTAESILRANDALKGDPNVLARTTYEPCQTPAVAARAAISTTSPAWRRSGWSGS